LRVCFRRPSPPRPLVPHRRLPTYLSWPKNLKYQVQSNLVLRPALSVGELIDQARWMPPAQLMHLVQVAYERGRAAATRCLTNTTGSSSWS